jgi:single-strand DNA-binding protein
MNKVMLIGRLTKAPELKILNGTTTACCNFTLAVDRPFKKGEADFIPCVAFGKQAENIDQWVSKGHMFALMGHLQVRSYEAKDGTKRWVSEVIVDDFQFIQPKSTSGSTSYEQPEPNKGIDMSSYDGDMPF